MIPRIMAKRSNSIVDNQNLEKVDVSLHLVGRVW